ncbi:MAG: nucleotidyltransferase domain-containing protein [Phycisphaerales bacterium]
MVATAQQQEKIKKDLVARVGWEKEVREVVIVGSFPTSATPNDLDIAVFQDGDKLCLPFALKHRRLLRPVVGQIPTDVIPVRPNDACGPFLAEIPKREVVYERSSPDTRRGHRRYV